MAHGQDAALMREAFARDLADPQRPLFVAGISGEIVGYGRTAPFQPPAEAPPDIAPAGYYLSGVLVAATHRRRRLGHALTLARLHWIFERAAEAHYFTGASNLASIALHAQMGFVEVTREFTFPNVAFDEETILYRLTRPSPSR